jgi:hypothetical protein
MFFDDDIFHFGILRGVLATPHAKFIALVKNIRKPASNGTSR